MTKKKDAASKRINKVEIALILMNSACSILLFVDALDDIDNWDFIGSLIMLVSVLYILFLRYRRRKSENTFDRTMFGELDHAIANTNSIIHISRMMITGYLIPMSIYLVLKMLAHGAALEKWLMVIGMYSLAFLLIVWERKNYHLPRKNSLIALKKKLTEV
ncbi:MAG: hypothetical protein HRT61_11280 [Ekhidna sp.]|nr:hypothetical protein [Ekhidna sp.]